MTQKETRALVLRLVVNHTNRTIDFLSGTVVKVINLDTGQQEKPFPFKWKLRTPTAAGIRSVLNKIRSAGPAYPAERAILEQWRKENPS